VAEDEVVDEGSPPETDEVDETDEGSPPEDGEVVDEDEGEAGGEAGGEEDEGDESEEYQNAAKRWGGKNAIAKETWRLANENARVHAEKERLEERLKKLETAQEEREEDVKISDDHPKIQAQDTRIKADEGRIKSITAKQGKILDSLKTSNDRLAVAKERLKAADEVDDKTALEGRIESLEERIMDLRDRYNDHDSDTADIRERINDAKERREALVQELTDSARNERAQEQNSARLAQEMPEFVDRTITEKCEELGIQISTKVKGEEVATEDFEKITDIANALLIRELDAREREQIPSNYAQVKDLLHGYVTQLAKDFKVGTTKAKQKQDLVDRSAEKRRVSLRAAPTTRRAKGDGKPDAMARGRALLEKALNRPG